MLYNKIKFLRTKNKVCSRKVGELDHYHLQTQQTRFQITDGYPILQAM